MPQRKTIEEMQRLALLKGGVCLSTDYINVKTPLKWQCSKGHVWEANPVNIYNGNWCTICSKRIKLTLEDMKSLAESRGGKCLSDRYINNKTKMKWQCSQGHVWEARSDNVKNQSAWCPICLIGKEGNNRKLTIQEMKILAEEKGGRCLSEQYINANTKLTWQCQQGHIWEAKPAAVKKGSWCPVCAKDNLGASRRLSLEIMQAVADEKGGKCLSDSYKNVNTPMLWRCENGHTWEAVATSIRSGHWCPHCAGTAKHTIEIVKEFARKRGGRCLSNSYQNSRSLLKWECAEGHIFEANFHDVKGSGQWCPNCNKFYSEEKVRYILESLFNKPFGKTRRALETSYELDGYNEELKLAFEFHGIQHYQFVPYFHKTEENYKKRLELDRYKEQLCKEKGIYLIVVPYDSFESDNDLVKQITQKCKIAGYKITSKVNFDDFYRKSPPLDILRKLVAEKNGQLLSNEYINDKTKVTIKCEENHIFKVKPNNLRNGSWCPYCAGLMRLTIEDMHHLAKERGGKCLSTDYVNNKTPLAWECAKGHNWNARPDSVRNGKWCLICSGKQKLTIDEMEEIANSRGGKCLSSEYINDDTKLTWQCARGHVWEARPHNIKQGQWCRACSGSLKFTIEEMRRIAQSRGGYCLSDNYKDNKTKLKWKCAEGHIWEAIPNNIKSKGHWCPICSRRTR